MFKMYHVCGCNATATIIIQCNRYRVAERICAVYLCGLCSTDTQTHIYATEQQSYNNYRHECSEMAMTEVNLWNMATKMKRIGIVAVTPYRGGSVYR